jgi:hypothetical protein
MPVFVLGGSFQKKVSSCNDTCSYCILFLWHYIYYNKKKLLILVVGINAS